MTDLLALRSLTHNPMPTFFHEVRSQVELASSHSLAIRKKPPMYPQNQNLQQNNDFIVNLLFPL